MNLTNAARSVLRSFVSRKSITSVVPSSLNNVADANYRCIHAAVPDYAAHFKARDRKELLKSVRKPDEGLVNEHISLNANISSKEDMFTDERTPNLLFDGVPFNRIPICHVCITKNNAKFRINDWDNTYILYRTNGAEGFKKCRKGTNVAAQTTAMSIGTKALAKGVKDIRLKIQGLGPGRLSAIKGLQMSGLNIISVTDDTRISWKPQARPRKARRL